jgi:amino acid efflux transporter
VIGIAFAVTAIVYLALAATTIGVLGDRAGSAVPLADLLRVAVGSAGPVIAALAAVALTLAATNAYLSGAAALATELRASRKPRTGRPLGLQLGIAATSVLLLGGVATGIVTTAQLVAVPTALFLTVYLGCTAAAVRVLSGKVRIAAAASCVAVAGVLAFSGWAALVIAFVVAVGAAVMGPKTIRPVGNRNNAATLGQCESAVV